ncbi:nuclear transport factor 2 family protein [Flavobacterium luteum]|uniref:Nuclear transport factor 2 family protein n=1 Tax=Flavobacterium luteum TaxID=2026654 RepID=A0A7J5AHT5_9FLAO|nr:nuclear transport factor 2 family protein [Flavobacterium luteum]KAB1156968.1 nuclear transport factor 2 family protein [Flavobacterium luteum]
MKKLLFLFLLFPLLGFSQNKEAEKEAIHTLLNKWHKAATDAHFDAYFGALSDDAVFIGTDATENWNKEAFQAFAKPYFDQGKAWDFKPLKRNLYFSADGKTAWFDELLDTWMKMCRGSGVLIKTGNEWKIKQYVLSMTIPNDATDAVIKIKAPLENPLIEKLKTK